jgi:hypothetical protein
MLLLKIYVVGNNKTCIVPSAALKQMNVRLLITLLQTCSLAKQIVMADKSMRSLSVFVGVVVKHYKRSDGINHL